MRLNLAHPTSVTYWTSDILAIFSWIAPYVSILAPNWFLLDACSTWWQNQNGKMAFSLLREILFA